MPTPCQLYRDALYEQLARLTRAMAHPKRLMLLDLLLQAPRTVEVLASQIGISVASASQHLQVLRGARLVEAEKRGLYVTYRLADEQVYDLLRDLRTVAGHRLAEVAVARQQVQAESAHLSAMSPDQLAECLETGQIVLLDVRPPEEYSAAHLPGAISIPLDELEGRLAELPQDRPIVAYCRGEYCLMARQAVSILQERGYLAHYLEEGVMDLAAAGVQVERA